MKNALSCKNILIGSRWFPEPDTNSGDLRQWELLRLLVKNGCRVTYISERASSPSCIKNVESLGCEVFFDESSRLRNVAEMGAFLSQCQPDIAIIETYGIFSRYDLAIRRYCPNTALILDTVDVHALRAWRQEKLNPTPDGEIKARETARQELSAVRSADAVWVVSDFELRLLLVESPCVSVVPNIHKSLAVPPAFENTEGVVFLGGYRHPPNVDAVYYFQNEILPLIRSKAGKISVTYAGSFPPESVVRLHDPARGVIVPGYVDDHRALLTSRRVAIAPLRYGAGMKGKVGEYLACGIPAVLTSVAAEGMHLKSGKQVMIADDAEAFARSIVELNRNQDLWNKLSGAGRAHIQDRFSPGAVEHDLMLALKNAIASSRRRVSPVRRLLRRFWRLPAWIMRERSAECWLRKIVTNER